jgi:hypothetical protein
VSDGARVGAPAYGPVPRIACRPAGSRSETTQSDAKWVFGRNVGAGAARPRRARSSRAAGSRCPAAPVLAGSR